MQHVQVIINGARVDVASLSIDFEFLNPFFTDSVFQTAYNYSHDLPLTPKNKSVFGFVNRFDVSKDKRYPYQLLLDGAVFIDGIAYVDAIDDHSITISVTSNASELVKKMNDKLLNEIPFDTVTVYDEGIQPIDKVEEWKNHMTNIMFNEDPTTGTHKFPMIQTRGYDGQLSVDNQYFYHNDAKVNIFGEQTYFKNFPVPRFNIEKLGASTWAFSVAPCPRIAYILDQVFKFYNITKTVGAVWNEQELLQMITFAGITIDNNVRLDTNLNEMEIGQQGYEYEMNIHLGSFNLGDFVPKTPIYNLFKMLNEVFGVVFNLEGKTLTAISFKEVFQKSVADYSKYNLDQVVDSINDKKILNVRYREEDNNVLPIIFLPQSITNQPSPSPGIQYYIKYSKDWIDNGQIGIVNDNSELSNSIELSHFPMRSSLFFTEGYIVNNDGLGDEYKLKARGEIQAHLQYPYAISSVLGDKQERAEEFFIGCYRGVYQTIQQFLASPEDESYTVNFFDEPWAYSYSKVRWGTNTEATDPYFPYIFGKSIYLSRFDGTYANNLKYFYQLMANHKVMTVDTIMPAHVLMQLQRFTDIKHLIKDKRGNQIGYLAKISGSITEKGLGIVTLEYRVPGI